MLCNLAENAEITVECNPESTDQAVLEAMHKHGVNRLSFGVQAAHDTELKPHRPYPRLCAGTGSRRARTASAALPTSALI
ncbi:MAG: hypothetical protein ACLR4Z_09990 [Butyricicoccaceae bacterium]